MCACVFCVWGGWGLEFVGWFFFRGGVIVVVFVLGVLLGVFSFFLFFLGFSFFLFFFFFFFCGWVLLCVSLFLLLLICLLGVGVFSVTPASALWSYKKNKTTMDHWQGSIQDR